jgi:flagellar capping protein FliD
MTDELKECYKKRTDLQETVWELQRKLRDQEIEYKAKFNALVLMCAQYECVSPDKVKQIVAHLLNE